jgi:hypothetical protein
MSLCVFFRCLLYAHLLALRFVVRRSRRVTQVREIRRQTVTKAPGPASAPKPKEKKKGGCSIL